MHILWSLKFDGCHLGVSVGHHVLAGRAVALRHQAHLKKTFFWFRILIFL